MHPGDLWQEYNHAGEVLETAGRPASAGNPEVEDERYVSSSLTWLYRRGESGVEVLFQKRSLKVDRHPGLWDVSAGGHINLGETPPAAAVRETREEIGAEIDQEKLEFVIALRSPRKGLILNEYLYDWTGRPDVFHFDDQEVEEVKWVSLADFDDFLDHFAKPPLKEDAAVRDLIKKRLEVIQNGNH